MSRGIPPFENREGWGTRDWSRDLTVQSGSDVKLNAVLEKE